VDLTVVPSGSVLSSYKFQWKWNGQSISGATNATLSLVQIRTADAGLYSVTVSNIAGTLKSPLARLTVWTPSGVISAWGQNTYGQSPSPLV